MLLVSSYFIANPLFHSPRRASRADVDAILYFDQFDRRNKSTRMKTNRTKWKLVSPIKNDRFNPSTR